MAHRNFIMNVFLKIKFSTWDRSSFFLHHVVNMVDLKHILIQYISFVYILLRSLKSLLISLYAIY